MPTLPALITTTAVILLGSTAHASAESVRELNPVTGKYNCPVYSPCGPGMVGYNAGKDENGCDRMACRPDDEVADDDRPGLNPPDENDDIEYEYKKPDAAPPIAPRLIDVQ